MPPSLGIAVGIVATVALAVGAGTATSGRVAYPSAASLLLRSGEMPGFRPSGTPFVTRSVTDFARHADDGYPTLARKDGLPSVPKDSSRARPKRSREPGRLAA